MRQIKFFVHPEFSSKALEKQVSEKLMYIGLFKVVGLASPKTGMFFISKQQCFHGKRLK